MLVKGGQKPRIVIIYLCPNLYGIYVQHMEVKEALT